MNQTKEFMEGFESYLAGDSRNANPYPIYKKESGSWISGFSAAQTAETMYYNRPYIIKEA